LDFGSTLVVAALSIFGPKDLLAWGETLLLGETSVEAAHPSFSCAI
jgi:hypothetical protein